MTTKFGKGLHSLNHTGMHFVHGTTDQIFAYTKINSTVWPKNSNNRAKGSRGPEPGNITRPIRESGLVKLVLIVILWVENLVTFSNHRFLQAIAHVKRIDPRISKQIRQPS